LFDQNGEAKEFLETEVELIKRDSKNMTLKELSSGKTYEAKMKKLKGK
jgi:L-2-hydroxyglutarate oxidase LhgO